MPFHRPIPESPRPRTKISSGIDTLVQAEKMMQIAMLLPCSALMGWGAGWWIDSKLHTDWIGLAGLVFGGISGLVYVVRLVIATSDPKTKKGSSGEL